MTTNTAGSVRLNVILRRFSPDCLIFNAVDRGVLSLADIGLLEWPIVWFVRDSWIYTGGCLFKLPRQEVHFQPQVNQAFFTSLTCDGYKHKCVGCPILKPSETSIAATHYAIKARVLESRPDIVFAGISEWITRQVSSAPLTKNNPAVCIPNWVPAENSTAGSHRRSPIDNSSTGTPRRMVVLVGAHSLSNQRKGLRLLEDAIRADPAIRRNVDFVAIGRRSSSRFLKELGHLDAEGVGQALQDCDVVCIPSLQESQSIFAIEATLRGKPVVCFDTSGLATLVTHKVNGYLARAFDAADLIRGVRWVLEEGDYQAVSEAARSISHERFSNGSAYSRSVEMAAKTAMGLFATRRPDFQAVKSFIEPWELDEQTRDLHYVERKRLQKFSRTTIMWQLKSLRTRAVRVWKLLKVWTESGARRIAFALGRKLGHKSADK
jgi:glycosyltransferase involved in cell wall biosynthesis